MKTLIPALLLAALPLHGSSAQEDAPAQAVTVILVRHAETAGSTLEVRDPELSEEGQERARALAHTLARTGVTHLFASEYVRTRATLGPLAEAVGLEVQMVPARDAEQQVELLRALAPGSIAVVAGHSNTVPRLARALGGEMRELVASGSTGDSLPHEEHDRLVLLTLGGSAPPERAHTLELRYGP